MNVVFKSISFILSLLILFLTLLIVYKVGKRRGIKKALYRTAYMAFTTVLSFVVAPYLTDLILNLNLYPLGLAIHYNGLNFYRIIDFIEEVIVHNDVLNDIYNVFPNLKSLLIDFPHVVFIPFVYVLAFVVIIIILLPVYKYLSFKRERRSLYEVEKKNRGGVWAGLITCIQMMIIFSVVLTPINGLVRVYAQSKKGTLSSEENICAQTKLLGKYEAACLVIEGYDSSFFSMMSKNPINSYIYDSLTRVEYGDTNTTFSSELTNIARVGIVLNKTGLLDDMNMEITRVSDIANLNFKGVSASDIELIVSAFEESMYSREILEDVYELARDYLNTLLRDELRVDVSINLSYSELVKELRIILLTINLILENEDYIDNIYRIYKIIEDYENSSQSDEEGLRMFFRVAYAVDLEALTAIYDLLSQSLIYRVVIPSLLQYVLSTIEINVTMTADPDELDTTIRLLFGLVEIIKKHHTYNIFKLLAYLSYEEVEYLAKVVTYMCNSKTMRTFFFDLANFGIKSAGLKLDIPTELIFEIKDWTRELLLGQIVMRILYEEMMYGYIDYDLAWYGLTHYSNTVIFAYAWRMGIDMLPDVFAMWIAGKDYKYLVGEYVQ